MVMKLTNDIPLRASVHPESEALGGKVEARSGCAYTHDVVPAPGGSVVYRRGCTIRWTR